MSVNRAAPGFTRLANLLSSVKHQLHISDNKLIHNSFQSLGSNSKLGEYNNNQEVKNRKTTFQRNQISHLYFSKGGVGWLGVQPNFKHVGDFLLEP